MKNNALQNEEAIDPIYADGLDLFLNNNVLRSIEQYEKNPHSGKSIEQVEANLRLIHLENVKKSRHAA
jgi:hypothetical protein